MYLWFIWVRLFSRIGFTIFFLILGIVSYSDGEKSNYDPRKLLVISLSRMVLIFAEFGATWSMREGFYVTPRYKLIFAVNHVINIVFGGFSMVYLGCFPNHEFFSVSGFEFVGPHFLTVALSGLSWIWTCALVWTGYF
jgi:hypothetical protein